MTNEEVNKIFDDIEAGRLILNKPKLGETYLDKLDKMDIGELGEELTARMESYDGEHESYESKPLDRRATLEEINEYYDSLEKS